VRRIVEGIIVEKSWKRLVNAARDVSKIACHFEWFNIFKNCLRLRDWHITN
jgi:hypothetical protein